MTIWIFGYGSLIWRPDFDFLEQRRARLHGWLRRFWQGSHDHRGVPHRPGRVVTLVEAAAGHCDGMAYRVDLATAERTFEALDYREKNGYQRREVSLELLPDAVGAISRSRTCGSDLPIANAPGVRDREIAPTVGGVVYIAATDNHAYLGPAPLAEIARQIATSTGPSGTNRDYLVDLAEALRAIDAHDPHVFEIEAAVREHAALGRQP